LSYLTEVLADSPTHFWRLADPGGEWGADVGSAAPEMLTFKPQASGSALGTHYSGPNTDGGSWFINPPSYGQSAPIQAAFPFSVEACIFTQYVSVVLQAIVAWDYDTQTVGLAVGGALPGVYVAYSSGGNVAGGVPSKYVWDHLVAVYTAAATTLYVNGANVGVGAATALGAKKNLYIGRTSLNGAPLLTGSVSEIAIYPTALAAGRVAAHFAAVNQRHQTPVYGASGDFSGASTNAAYTDLLLKILQSVRKPFVDL